MQFQSKIIFKNILEAYFILISLITMVTASIGVFQPCNRNRNGLDITIDIFKFNSFSVNVYNIALTARRTKYFVQK